MLLSGKRRTSWYGSPTALRRYGPGSWVHDRVGRMLANPFGRLLCGFSSGLSDPGRNGVFFLSMTIIGAVAVAQVTTFFDAVSWAMWGAGALGAALGLLDVVLTKAIIAEALVRHGHELGVQKRRFVLPARYGIEDSTKWEKEKQHFVARVLVPALGARCGQVRWSWLYLAIDDVADDAIALLPKHRFDPDMDPFDYEHLCAELLVDAGWSAHATKASGDQGADVLAERDGERAVLQCKLYSSPVGNKAVQEVHAARGHYQAKWAVVVSNQTYTPSARELAQSLNVLLVHHDELARLSDLVRASS